MRNRLLLWIIVSSCGFSPSAVADNWPHWRGPDRNGVSREIGLPERWSRQENVVWRLALPGVGGATPIVWEDRVFLHVAAEKELFLWCIDRHRGTLTWSRRLDDRNVAKRKGNMSSPSPVTDGRLVWVMTGTGILTAFDFGGRRIWQRDLQREFGDFGILHGYSSSPLLHENSLYVQVLHGFYTDDPSYVLALDKTTGETKWRVDRPTDAPKEAPDAYTTPALLETGSGFLIVVSGADYVTAHHPETGREVWRLGGLNPTANPMQRIVASPIVVGPWIIVPSRVRPMLALKSTEKLESPEVVWSSDRGPDVPTPAFDGERLYVLTDNGVLSCIDALTGRLIWGPERLQPSSYSASPVVAGGRLYATNERGLTTVVAVEPEFRVLAENSVDENTLASLAISDGQIFLRTSNHLYCIAEPEGGKPQDRVSRWRR